MKVFTFIFSIYLALISLVPCGDMSECNSIKQVSHNHSENHDSHDHDTEHCSPFCICSCCGISVISFDYRQVSFAQIASQFPIAKIQPVYQFFYITQNYFKIWQPPKI